jgi:hypothetical protein
MSYFVVVTFDIANGRFEDYEAIYKDFAAFGLSHTLKSGQGNTVKLPTTTTAGEFNGQGPGSVRDHVCDQTQQCFRRRNLRGEVFVSVGGDWAWGHRQP